MTADLIIPLGRESVDGKNDELRLFLRSLERNARNVGEVWLVTDCPPNWLQPGNGLTVLPCPDRHAHNKDANLFEKTKLAMERSEADSVVFTADDCAVLQPCDFAALPLIYNTRELAFFLHPPKNKRKFRKWNRRMAATLAELGLVGGNYDTHCPQRWNRAAGLEAIAATPYTRPEGRCICTAILGRIHGTRIPEGAVMQNEAKETGETNGDVVKFDKWFVAYNDVGFKGGLREELFRRFPEASRWER